MSTLLSEKPLSLKRWWPTALVEWAPFAAILLWSIRFNPLTHVPAYGDVLEVMWGQDWYAEALRHGRNPLFYSQVFYPIGWHTAILAHTPLFLLAMGLLRLLLPAALVYNLFALGATLVAYKGMQRLLGLYVQERWIILLVALLFAFWGLRWPRILGHLHTAWLSALLPWQAWLLQSNQPRRLILWSGIIWALEIVASLYGLWFGALVLVLDWLSRPTWVRLKALLLISGITAVLSAPTLFLFWQAQQASEASFYTITQIAGWAASLNELMAPTLYHAWLQPWTMLIYVGQGGEGNIVNFGVVASLLVLIWLGLGQFNRQDLRQRCAVWLLVGGVLLALGPVLQWDDKPLLAPALQTMDHWLWQLGHSLKPNLFPERMPRSWQQVIPLPAWLFYSFIPFSEGARVVARFGLVAGMGLFPLMALALTHIRRPLAIGFISCLLLFEGLPWLVFTGMPWPPAIHPALRWLAEQPTAAHQAVLMLDGENRHLAVAISGETLYASQLVQKPTISGVGSFWPRATHFMDDWLRAHAQFLADADLQPLLWGYEVQWLLVPVRTKAGRTYLATQTLPALTFKACFDPPPGPTAWPDVLCVLAVKPAPAHFNVALRDGWSGAESWGRWAEGRVSTAAWVAPLSRPYQLRVTAFPNCLKNINQVVQLQVNGHNIGALAFTGCDQIAQEFVVPKAAVSTGWNTLTLRPKYAVAPTQLAQGQSADPRLLAAGFTQLLIEPQPGEPQQ